MEGLIISPGPLVMLARRRKKLTQEAAAKELGIAERRLRDIELDKVGAEITLAEIQAISAFFEIDPSIWGLAPAREGGGTNGG